METDVRRIVKTELAFMVKLQMQCLAMHIQRWSWVKNYQKCKEIGHVMIAKVLFMNGIHISRKKVFIKCSFFYDNHQ
jgi:hypothetical protein